MSVIAIVDDQSTNRHIYTMLARSAGDDIVVESFADPAIALGWIAGHRPDLIITDYRMPEMDGADFTRAVRATQGCAAIPVLVLTAYDNPSFRVRALEAGATAFLQTPIRHAEFQNRVRSLLRAGAEASVRSNNGGGMPPPAPGGAPSRRQIDGLMQVIDSMPALIRATDAAGRCAFANEAYARHVGRHAEQCAGRSVAELHAHLGAGEDPERDRTLDGLVFVRGETLPSYEESFTDADNIARTLLTTKSPLRDARGAVVNVLTTSLDITDQKRAQRHLHYLARHDALTGLANRALFGQRLEESITRSARDGQLTALFLLDLDHFKNVNDTLGHDFGDDLLVSVSRLLSSHVRGEDVVARLGGDEFAILQENVSGTDAAAQLAARLGQVLSEPIPVRDRWVNLSASIGITLSPQDSTNGEELLKNADLAMYQAKAGGRQGHRFFTPALRHRVEQDQLLDAGMRAALADEQFVLHYQPQIDLRTGAVSGVEALLRWNRPGHGLVAPGQFLRAAEESGFIVPLTEWVLGEACQQIRRWEAAGLPFARMAINVSSTQFRRQDVHRLVMETTERLGVAPDRLELELTESLAMDRNDGTVQILEALRRDGVSLALDDFGTGFSCLDYLRYFKVNRIKIDRSFLQGVPESRGDNTIVRTIIGLAHGLDVVAVAEGVESAAMLEFLRAENCDEAQGYYFGRPCAAESCAALIRQAAPQPALAAGAVASGSPA